jgi:putative flippase GtrA
MTQSDLSMNSTSSSTETVPGIIQRIAARFGGDKAKELERFLKFAVVGAIGAVIDLTITNILLGSIFQPTPNNTTPAIIAASCGFTVAVVSNFTFNRYWTYPESRNGNLKVQLAQFFAVNLVGLLIRGLIVYTFTAPFRDFIKLEASIFFPALVSQWATDTFDKLGANMAVVLALGVVMMWNFFVNRKWTYKDVK